MDQLSYNHRKTFVIHVRRCDIVRYTFCLLTCSVKHPTSIRSSTLLILEPLMPNGEVPVSRKVNMRSFSIVPVSVW